MRQSFDEVIKKVLGRRILSVSHFSTMDNDIAIVILQLDDGSHFDIGGKGALAVRFRPFLGDKMLYSGNPDVFSEESVQA